MIIVLFEYLNGLSLSLLGVCLLTAIIAFAEIGWLIGKRSSVRTADKDAGSMATAALGLLALLIAFTYSMSLARYDQRRSLVLEEANAIGSTANFALMLPAADQPKILDTLTRYAEVRVNLGVPYDSAKMERDIRQSNALLAMLWQAAVAQSAEAPQSRPFQRYVTSLNQTTNVAEARVTALRTHVPVEILMMLAGTALIAMGFVGYAAGMSGVNRQIPMVIMSALLAFLIVVTQDLARPDRGSITVSAQALQDTLGAIPSAAVR